MSNSCSRPHVSCLMCHRSMSLAPFSSSREPEGSNTSSSNRGSNGHMHAGALQRPNYALTGVLVHQGGSLHSGESVH